MANYVRFQRGTQEAYNKLKENNRLNDYTLYFIYDKNDVSIGTLYMGSRLISGGDATVVASALKDLTDVVINGSGENYFLVQNTEGKWVSTSLEAVTALIKSQLDEPDLSNLVTKEELNLLQTQVSTLENTINNKVDKVIYEVPILDENGNPVLDDEGNPTYKEVEGTLLSPEDKEKLNALVLDEDGSGIEISGTVNAENVQGLGTWITTNANTYIKGLTESNLSQSIIDKLNYINAVDTTHFTAVNGTLKLHDDITNTLTAVKNGDFNFIKSVDENIFSVNVGKLELKTVSIEALKPVLGDLDILPHAVQDFTLVDEINNIYDILTWTDIETE